MLKGVVDSVTRSESCHILSLLHKEVSLQMKLVRNHVISIAECCSLFPFLKKLYSQLERDHYIVLREETSAGIEFINQSINQSRLLFLQGVIACSP